MSEHTTEDTINRLKSLTEKLSLVQDRITIDHAVIEIQTAIAEAVELQELNQGLRWSIRNAERDLTEMREERDAVRRKFCEMCASVGGVYRRVGRENVECRAAEEIADICGWDCYEVKP